LRERKKNGKKGKRKQDTRQEGKKQKKIKAGTDLTLILFR
jgi:hypothetical protein